MIKTTFLIIGLAGLVAADPAEAVAPAEHSSHEAVEIAENSPSQRGRELFAMYAHKNQCARRGCAKASDCQPVAAGERNTRVNPIMSALGDAKDITKGPLKAIEMLALNDDLNTVINSDSMCTRRRAMGRAAGLAAGLSLAAVSAPGFAAETKKVQMGADSGQLVFVPDETKICAGDSITWVNNKAGPHNVVFDEEEIPDGVGVESISMDGLLNSEGETFTKKFTTPGSYSYYCEPHRGAGMNGVVVVS